VLLAISLAAIALRKRYPYFLAGWLWYWVMLFPVLGIIQVGWQAHADRYTYLPHIGLYLALTWAVADVSRSWPHRRKIMTVLSGLVIVILAWLAWEQTSYWRDSESLWRHAITVTPDNHIASTNLGDSLLKKGRTDDAIAQYQNSLRLERTDSDAENGMGSALFREEQGDQAIEHYQRAVALRPEDPEFHNNLGNALCYKGRLDDGIANYRRAIELRPDRADLNNAETEFNLANALLRKNQIEEAVLHYRRALEIQPNDADTNDNLATALLRNGREAEAMEHFQKALQINPESASIRSDFAWALATCSEQSLRNGPRAVELAEKARQLVNGRDPIILRTVAAAYAESGQFSQAIETARNALQLAAAQRNAPLVRTLQKELDLYQTGLPFHEAAR
jgi:protein O-mannosyl-transferase